MRIFLQTPPRDAEAPRYCHLILQQDLLGGWMLLRESGHQGGRATLKREVYLDRDAAEAALMAARDKELKRGFQVMFTQGAEVPAGLRYGE
jgi:hypothetical protein